jgi:hypothetical protein
MPIIKRSGVDPNPSPKKDLRWPRNSCELRTKGLWGTDAPVKMKLSALIKTLPLFSGREWILLDPSMSDG